MLSDHPRGVIVVRGDDIGVIGAVAVEVDGEVVCLLHPSAMRREFTSLMGRTSTSLTFDGGDVQFRDAPASGKEQSQ